MWQATQEIITMFDFDIFSRQVIKAFRNGNHNGKNMKFSLVVCKYYFKTYRKHTGREHPPLKQEHIERILDALHYHDDLLDGLNSGDYAKMIDKHFKTEYDGGDYNILHFLSGDIRIHRFYEGLY